MARATIQLSATQVSAIINPEYITSSSTGTLKGEVRKRTNVRRRRRCVLRGLAAVWRNSGCSWTEAYSLFTIQWVGLVVRLVLPSFTTTKLAMDAWFISPDPGPRIMPCGV